jgi:hypothetical protein
VGVDQTEISHRISLQCKIFATRSLFSKINVHPTHGALGHRFAGFLTTRE